MTRYEAMSVIYEVINSGIIDSELEEELTEVVNHICDDDFDVCPKECLRHCKLDECPNAEKWAYEPDYDYDEEYNEFVE